MKIILTGSSGFIGTEILSQCVSHPSITSIIALSRRELPTTHPKLQTLILSDFESYPESLLVQLADAEACIYALGDNDYSKPEINRRINLDYTLAAANAFANSLAPRMKSTESRKFRFIYCSGFLTRRDQEKRLWFIGDMRKMRGLVESRLIELGNERAEGGFEVVVARPAFVFAKGAWLKLAFGIVTQTIYVDLLAAAMIELALHGTKHQTCENDELVRSGNEVHSRT